MLKAYPVHVYRFALQGDDLFIALKFLFSCLIQVVYHCIEELTAGKREGNNASLALAHEAPLSDAKKVTWGKPCAGDLQLDLRKTQDMRTKQNKSKQNKKRKRRRGDLRKAEKEKQRKRS